MPTIDYKLFAEHVTTGMLGIAMSSVLATIIDISERLKRHLGKSIGQSLLVWLSVYGSAVLLSALACVPVHYLLLTARFQSSTIATLAIVLIICFATTYRSRNRELQSNQSFQRTASGGR